MMSGHRSVYLIRSAVSSRLSRASRISSVSSPESASRTCELGGELIPPLEQAHLVSLLHRSCWR